MLKVTFKDVGQGDSILIEWIENNIPKIAIIDCHKHNSHNPVLEHLIKNNYKEIQYIILSHPHYDHFSGIREIFNYFAENKFSINYFLHTSLIVPDFLKTASKSAIAEKELQKLFLSARELAQSLKMKIGSIQYELPINKINLGTDYSMTILSPSLKEIDNYVRNVPIFNDEEDGVNNPNANWLSTILRIDIKDSYLLLTSDCEKSSLIRVDKKESTELENVMILGQTPHHGSGSNHNNAFWRKRNKVDQLPIICSVGTNNYNHPSKATVDFFSNSEFKLFATNNVGGLLNLDKNSEASITTQYLDMYSTMDNIDISRYSGDKEFIFR